MVSAKDINKKLSEKSGAPNKEMSSEELSRKKDMNNSIIIGTIFLSVGLLIAYLIFSAQSKYGGGLSSTGVLLSYIGLFCFIIGIIFIIVALLIKVKTNYRAKGKISRKEKLRLEIGNDPELISKSCPKCGTENPDHAKYCFKCGGELD